MRARAIAICLLIMLALFLSACGRDTAPAPRVPDAPGADTPADAVRQLTAYLVANDLGGFTREAVPADLHARLDSAWREGRTRWPLDELPLSGSHPNAMAALAADDAQASLQHTFDRQFANAAGELRSTAATLGLFGTQFVQMQAGYSETERQHFAQVIAAVSTWAMSAPLTQRKHATEAIHLLTTAARDADLTSAEAFAAAGMDDALQRMTPVIAASKQALALYGLDIDAGLADMQVTLQSQTGDTAKVRMQYALAGTPIDTVTDVIRKGGRWYVSDFVTNAEVAVVTGPPDPADEQE